MMNSLPETFAFPQYQNPSLLRRAYGTPRNDGGIDNLFKGEIMGIPIGQWSGSDSIDKLHETIKAFNEASTKQTKHLIILTWAIVLLTVLMLIGLVVQIYLAVAVQ